MANEIKIKVTAEDAGTFAKVEEEAKGAGERVGKTFGEEIDKGVGKGTDGTGKKTGEKIGSDVTGSLNKLLTDLKLPPIDVKADSRQALAELGRVQAEIKALASDNMTIEAKVKTDAALKEVDKFAKNFIKEGDDAGSGFLDSFSKSIAMESPGMLQILGPVLAGFAPWLGATIAGGIIGGVGLGGIVGGTMLAVKDPRVQTSIVNMRLGIQKELETTSKPFIETTLVGVSRIGNAIKGINFKQIFADSAQNAIPIINGIATAITGLGKGIADIIHNAGPVMQQVGNGIGNFGKTIGDGFTELSKDGPAAAAAMHDLFTVVNFTTASIFGLVDGLTRAYDVLRKIPGGDLVGQLSQLAEESTSIRGKTVEMAQAIEKNGLPALDQYNHATKQNVESLNELADATDTAANAQLGLFGDVTSVAKEMANAAKSAQQNGRTLDANTQKGRNNRDALEALGKSLIKQNQDYLALNGAGAATNAVMARNRDAFERAAESMTNSKKAAQQLTNAIFGIPDKDVYVHVHQVSDGPEIVDSSGHRYGGYSATGATVSGMLPGAAGGGARGGLTWVGERGPELLRLPPGTSVSTNGDSVRAMGSIGGPGAAGPGAAVTVRFDKSGLFGLAAALVETLRAEVRTGGGNVQQYLGVAGA